MKNRLLVRIIGWRAFRRRLLDLPIECEQAVALAMGVKLRRARIRGRR